MPSVVKTVCGYLSS